MSKYPFMIMHNGEAVSLAKVPSLRLDDFLQNMIDAVGAGWRIASFFGWPEGESVCLYAILSSDVKGELGVMSSRAISAYPALTPRCPQAHMFEREIFEECRLLPEGHPWLKPVRFLRASARDDEARPGVTDFFQVSGKEVHEVAVGPVHAGVIEPGHFRFQCYGEQVLHLEITLGYQHRGIEAGLAGGPYVNTMSRMEAVAGDTTIGHASAYVMILEALSNTHPPARAEALRSIALELERLANHAGDLGAIAGDVGYLPTASFCGRIRGDFLNMTALMCGSRFGRGLIRPSGTEFDLNPKQQDELRKRIEKGRADLANAVNLLWNTPSVMGRLENTGVVDGATAELLGLVGLVARACGLERDTRRDHPFGFYRTSQIPVMTAESGDVYARALVRWLEALKSLDFLDEHISRLPGGQFRNRTEAPKPEKLAVAMAEGWRGEICHVAITDKEGRFARYKITDSSLHNWQGLSMALRDEQISDFPLCNKSFNLSYCGFDR